MKTQSLFIRVACAAALCLASVVRAEEALDPLAVAVRALRGITLEDFQDEEAARAKGEAMQDAWQTLLASPGEAAALLRAEGGRVIDHDEKDYAFLLGAAALLFELEGMEAAGDIDRFWGYSREHLALNAYYTFVTAVRMAMLRDERAILPLRHLLADRDIVHFVPEHSLVIRYPLTLWFTWGILGAKGEEGLLAVLDDPETEPAAVVAAMNLLSMLQSLPLLNRCRDALGHDDDDIRRSAIWCLGRFGHPDDFPTLESGVRDRAGKDFPFWQRAADDYGDLRLVDRYLEGIDGATAEELPTVVAGLFGLPATRGMRAIQALVEDPRSLLHQDGEAAEQVEKLFVRLTGFVAGLAGAESWQAFLALPEERQEAAWRELRSGPEEIYRLREGDRRLDREELLRVLAAWTEERRITGGDYAWVEERHILDAAGEQDLPALIALRAMVYSRLSDECLYEAGILNDIIHRLGRSRYRQDVGVTGAVVAPRP